MMKVGFEARKLCRWLFILTWVTCISAQSCTYNSQCASFAKCAYSITYGKYTCTCKYGSSYYFNGILKPCLHHCKWDSDCPSYADCDRNIFSGNRCQCNYGGGVYSGLDPTSCGAPSRAGQIAGSVIGAIIFVIIVVSIFYCLRRRRLLHEANAVTVCIQPTPVSQQMTMPTCTTQAVYPTQQYSQVAPPDQGFSNPGFGYSQPPPYPGQHK